MRHLVRAALPGAMIVAITCAWASTYLSDAGNGYDGTLHASSPSVATVTASPTSESVAPQPFCDVATEGTSVGYGFCVIPDERRTGEWVVYVTGHNQIAMYHWAYPIDAPERDAS